MPSPRPPFRRRLKPLSQQPGPWVRGWGWLLMVITVGLWLSLIPQYLAHWGLGSGGVNPNPSPPANVGTPLWRSGFEQGFPGEWRSRPPGIGKQTYSTSGKLLSDKRAHWTILGKNQARSQGVSVPQGHHIYQGQITAVSSRIQAAYPVLALEMVNPSYFARLPQPVMNEFYLWVDWDSLNLSAEDWLNLVTLANNEKEMGVSLQVRGPKNQLALVGAGVAGGFSQGDGWELIAPGESVNLPLRRWVKLTLWVDYEKPLLIVWMDDIPIFKANGGQLKPQAQSSPYLWRAHWGLKGASSLKKAWVYNDDIQIWTWPEPLNSISFPPSSPYQSSLPLP